MNLSLESDLLRVFLAVAETGSLTRAGEEVGRTQSAVSMQIKRLEEMLGEAVFTREARGVSLTPAGEKLLVYARRIVGLVDEATMAMRSRQLGGPVRIGIPEEYGQTILPHVLAAFAERHPAVEVTTRFAYSAQQMSALENDEIDLAVVFDWSRRTAGELLCVDPTVWVTSNLHQLHEQEPVPIAIYHGSNWGKDFALRSLERHGVAYRIAFTSDTSAGLRLAVQSGLAIAPISRSNIPAECYELTLRDGYPMVDSSRVVLRRNPRRSSAAIQGMAEMLREAFGPLGAYGGGGNQPA